MEKKVPVPFLPRRSRLRKIRFKHNWLFQSAQLSLIKIPVFPREKKISTPSTLTWIRLKVQLVTLVALLQVLTKSNCFPAIWKLFGTKYQRLWRWLRQHDRSYSSIPTATGRCMQQTSGGFCAGWQGPTIKKIQDWR